MKFQIKHEIKGRIRFHVVQKKQMTCEQADILLYYLENMEGVESVKVMTEQQMQLFVIKRMRMALYEKILLKEYKNLFMKRLKYRMALLKTPEEI